MSDNLKIWNAVCKTDPKYTKNFSRSGGFSGTAINAEYIIKRLTELFGPIGHEDTWGYEVTNEELVPGKPFVFNNDTHNEVLHHVSIKFWYSVDGKKHEIPTVFGNTVYVGVNKNGPYTDEEASEKSVTDALSKAAKRIGVSADIHLGLWDDSKYVADRYREVGQQTAEELLGSAADSGREAFVNAYKALSQDDKQMVKPYLGLFEARVKKAEALKAELETALPEAA